MEITTAGKGVDVGESLQQHMRDNLAGAVGKYFDRAVSAQVTLSRDGGNFRSDVTVHVGKGIDVQGRATAADPYQAFDQAAERVAKRLRRFKRRLRDHHAGVSDPGLPAQRYVLSAPAEEEEDSIADDQAETGEAEGAAVIAESKTLVLAMSVAEAVMHLDLGEHEALMFRNRATGRLNTLYRRSDGNIGWIDPEGA
jgi:ribosomal subunit interface protein